MVINEKRRLLYKYCADTMCNGCKLCDDDWEVTCVSKPCLNIAESTEEDLDRAIAIIKSASVKDEPENDPVNKASHYNDGGIECIDAIAASMPPAEYAGFLKGQVLKYIWRYRLKGKPVEDLKKARYYLDRLIQIIEKEAV